MGLASALNTALTGMTAAETQIDVIGNNLANAQTAGFKESGAIFSSQFLQTLALGSSATESNGGTNPRQIGLGTQVAAIVPNFSQGTIEISANPSDLAIQGDGFFVVEGGAGEQLYTRNGIFKLNANNELVTTTGDRLLGHGVDENFQIETTQLTPLRIPLGAAAVAQATQNVFMEGILSPTGDVADRGEVLQSARLGDVSVPRPDTAGVALQTAAVADGDGLTGNYNYLITYHVDGHPESRPSPLVGPVNVNNGEIRLSDLPAPPPPPPEGGFPAYDQVRIYRNLASDSGSFYLVDSVDVGQDYVDNRSDAQISDLTNPANKLVDLDGPRINNNTLLTDVVKRDGLNYDAVFEEGTLTFDSRKGGRRLATREFTIEAGSTVQDLLEFIQGSAGIQTSMQDSQNPIPPSQNHIQGESTALSPGVVLEDGRIRIISNNGVDNAIDVGLSAFQLTNDGGELSIPNLGFGSAQQAVGQSAVTDMIVYDSLGVPLNVRMTAVLEQRTDSSTVYRWFADSPDNDPLHGSRIGVGTGLVTFDGSGNYISSTNSTVSIERRNMPSTSPLEIQIDFSQISSLASESSSLAAARQDGSAAGTLTSFLIGEEGRVRGVFNNGVTQDLGQIRLARFSNPAGMEQRGQNLYSMGVNAGLPVQGNPGADGMGKIAAGAIELSNTDIGKNLINLVTASTHYRGNARVITAAQQLLDELMNLRR